MSAKNEIIDRFFNGNSFAGFLAITPSGVVIFGYDADVCDEYGYFADGTASAYNVYSFEDVADGLEYIASQEFR